MACHCYGRNWAVAIMERWAPTTEHISTKFSEYNILIWLHKISHLERNSFIRFSGKKQILPRSVRWFNVLFISGHKSMSWLNPLYYFRIVDLKQETLLSRLWYSLFCDYKYKKNLSKKGVVVSGQITRSDNKERKRTQCSVSNILLGPMGVRDFVLYLNWIKAIKPKLNQRNQFTS